MEMGVTKEQYKKIVKEVEKMLKNYPYYLISIEMPGLGSAIRPDVVIDKNIKSDPVAKEIVDQEYKRIVVNAIECIYDKLDKDSKKIIDHSYFRDDKTNEEVMLDLKIDRNRYYKLKKNAIYKFAIGLGYC